MGNATQVVATNIDSLEDMRSAFNNAGISSFEFTHSLNVGTEHANLQAESNFLSNISVADFKMLSKANYDITDVTSINPYLVTSINDSVDNIETALAADSRVFYPIGTLLPVRIHATEADVNDALNMQSNTPGTVGSVADTFDLARVETWDAGLRSVGFANSSPKEGFPLQNRDYLVVPNDSPDSEATELTLVHLNGNTAQPNSMSVSDSAATFTVSKEDHPALFNHAISYNTRPFGDPGYNSTPESINPIYMELSTIQEATAILEAGNAPTIDNLTLDITVQDFVSDANAFGVDNAGRRAFLLLGLVMDCLIISLLM